MEIFTDNFVYRKIDGKIFHRDYPERAVPYSTIMETFGVDKSHVANHPDKPITEDSLLRVMESQKKTI